MNLKRHVARWMAALLAVSSVLGSAVPAAASTIGGAGGAAASGGSGGSPATATTTLASFGEPFHWLPPLGVEAGDATKFDASLLNGLTVTICRIEGSACTPVKTITSASALSERLRTGQTNGKDSYYLANWDVSKLKLEPFTFRVSVTIARLTVGTIDVGPATYKSFGRTWPIKFRVEKNPTIRVRVLHEAGKTAPQIASRVFQEFGVCGDDLAQLLANDLDPFTQKEIDLAIAGACQDVDIFPTTKVADDATNNALTTFDPTTGRMTFSSSTTVLANLKAGDVLVGEPAAAAENGYLRKVTSITKNKKTGVITVETTQAKLNEAVHEGVLDAANDLKPSDLLSSSPIQGVTFRATPDRRPQSMTGALDVGDGFDFHESIDVTFKGNAGDSDIGGTGEIHITGEMKFNAGWNVGIGIEDCLSITLACVDRFEAHVGSNLYSELHIDGTFDGHLQKDYVLDTHYFKPIIFFIGPIPVVLVPIVKAIVGARGDAHVEFSFDAFVTGDTEIGIKWTDPDDNGQGWQDVSKEPKLSGNADADVAASMELRGYGAFEGKLLLYGVAGPGLVGRVGVRALVQFPGTPLWELWAIANGELNVTIDIGGVLDLGGKHFDLPEGYLHLAQSENQPPVCGARTAPPIPVAVDDVVYLGPRFGGIYDGYFNCTDPETGDEPLYSATDENGVDVNLSAASWSAPGTHYVKVIATDDDGKSAEFTLTIEVIDTPPILSTTTGANSVPAGVQYWITASAYDVEEGGLLPCRPNLTWSASGGTVTESSSLTTCTVVVVFNQTGPQTITVVATDSNNKTSQQQVVVNVTAAPANAAPVIAIDSFDVRAVSGPPIGCDPFDPTCEDIDSCSSGFNCPVWQDSYLFNGVPLDGDYHGPLTLNLSASDPNGDPLTVTWHCVAGLTPYPVTDNGDGSSSCDPFTIKNSIPILVWAEVSDGTTTVRSEVRRMYMLDYLF